MYETLKTHLEDLRVEYIANYKRGLASVEERLVFHKNNEVIFTDQIAVLKSDASFNEAKIIALKSYIEKLKKEKEDNLLKINNYDNATKSLDKVIGSQLVDNNKKGLGYNAVPPPPTGLFAPPIIDLSHSGIEKFKEPGFQGYGVKVDKCVSETSSKEIKKTSDAPFIEDWVSDDEEQDKPKPKVVKKTVESKTVKQDVVSDGKLKKKTVFPYCCQDRGTDRIMAQITRPVGEPPSPSDRVQIQVDEIQNFVDGRSICPYEAFWRTFKFEIHSRNPVVQILCVHLKNIQVLIRIHLKEQESQVFVSGTPGFVRIVPEPVPEPQANRQSDTKNDETVNNSNLETKKDETEKKGKGGPKKVRVKQSKVGAKKDKEAKKEDKVPKSPIASPTRMTRRSAAAAAKAEAASHEKEKKNPDYVPARSSKRKKVNSQNETDANASPADGVKKRKRTPVVGKLVLVVGLHNILVILWHSKISGEKARKLMKKEKEARRHHITPKADSSDQEIDDFLGPSASSNIDDDASVETEKSLIDGNDDFFPVAFAIVDVEDDNNWRWFLEQLKAAILYSQPMTFVFDMEKNLKTNVKGTFQGWESFLPVYFLAAAHAVRLVGFRKSIEQIKLISSQAYDWVMQIEPQHWASSSFKGERYNHITDDVGGSLAKLMEDYQESSILHKIDALIRTMIDAITDAKLDACMWSTHLTPTKEKQLQEESLRSCGLKVLISSDTLFEVREDSTHVVNIGDWSCTCLGWKEIGLPCRHSLAVFALIESINQVPIEMEEGEKFEVEKPVGEKGQALATVGENEEGGEKIEVEEENGENIEMKNAGDENEGKTNGDNDYAEKEDCEKIEAEDEHIDIENRCKQRALKSGKNP
ncbi:PB1 domain-containing protein [Tanacetum coccineum]|uniref:PB1 domain-containing protein n=1 Tax=Tanacetum coccineum TaxID=301880 RepID=A0ABQ5GS04_9ASTR